MALLLKGWVVQALVRWMTMEILVLAGMGVVPREVILICSTSLLFSDSRQSVWVLL